MPPLPTPRIFPDADACATAAASLFLQLSLEAAEARRPFRVALSGGSTPKRLYAILSAAPFRDQVPWAKIHFFFSDERHVAPDHPDSNFGTARDGLFGKVPIPAANIHRVLAERPEATEAATLYQNAIAASFAGADGHEAVPRFDLVFLGMGPDGHTASLFPGTEALRETSRWVAANRVPKLNTDRITFTYPLINAAARVLLLITGADKAERIGEIFGPGAAGIEPPYPVQQVRPADGQAEWLLDEAAAARLPNRAAVPAA